MRIKKNTLRVRDKGDGNLLAGKPVETGSCLVKGRGKSMDRSRHMTHVCGHAVIKHFSEGGFIIQSKSFFKKKELYPSWRDTTFPSYSL